MRNGRKNANHACMNEQFFLEFHMASSHIEMKRSGIERGLLIVAKSKLKKMN